MAFVQLWDGYRPLADEEGHEAPRLPFRVSEFEASRLKDLCKIFKCVYGVRSGLHCTREQMDERAKAVHAELSFYMIDLTTWPILPSSEEVAIEDDPVYYPYNYRLQRANQKDLQKELTKDYRIYLRRGGVRYFLSTRGLYPEAEELRRGYIRRLYRFFVAHSRCERALIMGRPLSSSEEE